MIPATPGAVVDNHLSKVAGVFGTWRASESEGPRRWVRSPRSYFVQQGLRLIKGSCGVFTACRWAVVQRQPTEAWSRGVACRIVLMELDTRRTITQNKVDFIWGLCWVPGSDEFFTDQHWCGAPEGVEVRGIYPHHDCDFWVHVHDAMTKSVDKDWDFLGGPGKNGCPLEKWEDW